MAKETGLKDKNETPALEHGGAPRVRLTNQKKQIQRPHPLKNETQRVRHPIQKRVPPAFDVLDRLLAGEPIGRIVGAEAMKFGGWQRLNAEYAKQFGIETPNWPPQAAQVVNRGGS